jgi:hypothetical protein
VTTALASTDIADVVPEPTKNSRVLQPTANLFQVPLDRLNELMVFTFAALATKNSSPSAPPLLTTSLLSGLVVPIPKFPPSRITARDPGDVVPASKIICPELPVVMVALLEALA